MGSGAHCEKTGELKASGRILEEPVAEDFFETAVFPASGQGSKTFQIGPGTEGKFSKTRPRVESSHIAQFMTFNTEL